jgi:hypothetical protein
MHPLTPLSPHSSAAATSPASLLSACLAVVLCLATCFAAEQGSGNTIGKKNFNFGHQSGYMYARCEDAYFAPRGTWTFETGALAYYTSRMPLVTNPVYYERLMLLMPLHFEFHPGDNITLRLELTDLFIEALDYQRTHDIHLMGGKSPRFKTKIRLLEEKRFLPAMALTMGVTFSSAKPYTIWDNRLNYQESNGLAGAGTGVADYLILLALSKTIANRVALNGHIGLAPLGSPVEYGRGSGQMDEMPYGVTVDTRITQHFSTRVAVCGMYNFLHQGILADYAVARLNTTWQLGRMALTANVEHGLTRESDEWVLGWYQKFNLGRPRGNSRAEDRDTARDADGGGWAPPRPQLGR